MKKITKEIVKAVPFSRLSKAEKRVAIAKDVIQQIKREVLNAKESVYIENIDFTDIPYEDQNSCGIQVNSLMKTKGISCDCCAKGALFMSHVNKTNHLTVRDMYSEEYSNESSIVQRLSKIFTVNQLDLIETAFECRTIREENPYLCTFTPNEDDDDFYNNEYIDTEIAKKAISFGEKYDDPEERLIQICKNIIKNKGVFVP